MPFFKNLFSPPSAAAAEGNQSSHDKAGSTSTGRDERRDSEESAADKHFVPPSLPVEKNDGIKENQSEKIAGINGNSSEKEKLNSGMASLDLFSGLNILSVGSAANEVKREFGQQIGQAKDESEEKAIESTQKNPSAFGFIDGDQENEDIKVNTAPSAFEFMAESGLGDDNQERLLEGTIKTSPEPQETLKSPEFSRSPSELSSKDQRFLAEKSSSSEQENHGGVPTNIEGVSPDPIDEIKHGVEMMENQLSNHINSFESILNSHWRKLQELNAENEIIRRRENNIQMLIEKKQQEILKHEEDQAQHVEAEEFDLADRINCKIEDLKKEICELNEDLCGLDQQLEQSISDRTELTKNTVNQIKLLILEAKSIESINLNHSEKMELETRQVIEEEDSLVGLFERAEQVLGHIASDLEKVDDEKKVIDDEIVKITEDVQEEKKQLLSKQQILEMERDDLLAKLREKESELDQCSKEVDITQAKINKAAKMFERDLRRLKERRENIINEREQREKDHYNLQMKKLALEHRRQKLIEEDAHYKLILSQVSEHIIGAEKASRRLESYCSQRNKWLAMESKHNNDVRSLHMKLASANEKLDAESLEIVKFEEDIVKANQKILSNETTISGLNTEKVIAVKAKNFKKASQLSKEIKELEELNKGIRDSVAEFEATVEERKKVMEKEIRNRDLIEAELSLVEKKSDHIRYEALVSMEQEISLILEDLKESSPGRSYESDFLSEQLSDFRRELDRMRDKYGWDATSVTTADMNSIENIEEQGTTSEAALAEDLKQQIAKKKTMLEDFQMTLAEFEEKQAVAVEDEDYELADEIQTKIDVVNENISSAVEELEELERRLHSFGLNSARSVESGSIESHNSIEENQSEVICEENDGDTENVVVNEARISSVISSTEGLEKEISDLGTVLSEINENEEPEKAQEIRDHINQIQKLIDTPKSELEE